jgi:hypothetical protein
VAWDLKGVLRVERAKWHALHRSGKSGGGPLCKTRTPPPTPATPLGAWVPSRLELISAAQAGLAEQLAGRLDGHLAAFVAHLREGLLAASTAVGLEVMAELMDTEVACLVGPKGKHDLARTAIRHGSDDGAVTLGGHRLPIRRAPRPQRRRRARPSRQCPAGSSPPPRSGSPSCWPARSMTGGG